MRLMTDINELWKLKDGRPFSQVLVIKIVFHSFVSTTNYLAVDM